MAPSTSALRVGQRETKAGLEDVQEQLRTGLEETRRLGDLVKPDPVQILSPQDPVDFSNGALISIDAGMAKRYRDSVDDKIKEGRLPSGSEKNKLLADLDGKPTGVWPKLSARELGLAIVSVVGQDRHRVMREYRKELPQITFVVQEEAGGTGHAALHGFLVPGIEKARVAILVAGDQPLYEKEVFEKTLKAFEEGQRQSPPVELVVTYAHFKNPAEKGRVVIDSEGNVLGILEEKAIRRGVTIGGYSEAQLLANPKGNVSIYVGRPDLLVELLSEVTIGQGANEFDLTDIVEILREKRQRQGRKAGIAAVEIPEARAPDLSRFDQLGQIRALRLAFAFERYAHQPDVLPSLRKAFVPVELNDLKRLILDRELVKARAQVRRIRGLLKHPRVPDGVWLVLDPYLREMDRALSSTGLEEWVGPIDVERWKEATDPGRNLMQSFSGIRGLVGKPVVFPVMQRWPDEALSNEYRLAFAKYAYEYSKFQLGKLKGAFPDQKEFRFVLGWDARPSGQAVIETQVRGMRLAAEKLRVGLTFVEVDAVEGRDPRDQGILATPFVESLVRVVQADGGVISTASHNPPEWNGVKYLTAAKEPAGSLVAGGILLPARDMEGIVEEVKEWTAKVAANPEKAEAFRLALNRIDPSGKVSAVSRQELLLHVVQEIRRMWGLQDDQKFEAFRQRARQIRIVVDTNGGAASRDYGWVLREFGFTVFDDTNSPVLKSDVGKPQHLIEPKKDKEGDALAVAREALEIHQAHFAIVTDFDADRANTLFFDFAKKKVEEPGPPEVAAMNVAMALSRRTLIRQATRDPRTMAVVAHNAFPMRIKEISRVFDADVSVVETGEVNVLEKMRQLEAQGLDVVIGVETANGGTVFRGDHGQVLGDTSRNGAMTALFTGMVLIHPPIGRTWLAARNRYVSSSTFLAASAAGSGESRISEASSFRDIPAIEIQGPDPPSLVDLLRSLPGEQGQGSWHWVALQEKLGRPNDVPEERIVPFKQVMEELWQKEFRHNFTYQIIHHVGRTESPPFGADDPPGAGLGTHGAGATTLESSLPDGRFFSIGLRGSQTEGMLRAFVEVQGNGARKIAENLMHRFAQDWYPTALAAIRLPEAVERFRVERVRFGMPEKPIGFYLEGKGLRFARALALVSEQVGDIQRFHFAGVVPTVKERDALIASLAGHERGQEHLSRYLVAVDQEGKGSVEAARNLARLYLTGREVQDVLSLEMDLLAQLDRLLQSFGYRLPDDWVIRDAALTLLRAA